MPESGGAVGRSHSGDGDALLLTTERESLARIAYGRADSPADEARSAEARIALHELELREAAEREALASATRDAREARERRADRIRSRLVGIGGVAALAVLVGAGVMLLTPPPSRDDASFVDTVDLGQRSETPAAAPDVAPTPVGGAANAQFWFDESQAESDRTPSQLDGIDPNSTRSVVSDVEGWQVWVAKDFGDNLCLVVHETATGINAWTCTSPDQFASSGLLLTATGTTAISTFWDGFDLHSEPTPPSVGSP